MKLRVWKHSIWAVVAMHAATEVLASYSTVYLTVTKTVDRLANVGGPASNSSTPTIQKSSNTGTLPPAVASSSTRGRLLLIEIPAEQLDPEITSIEATSSIEDPDEWFPYEDGHLMIGWKKPHQITTAPTVATATTIISDNSTGHTLTSYSAPFSVTLSAASSEESFAPIATNDKGNSWLTQNQTKPREADSSSNGTSIHSDIVGSNVTYISVRIPLSSQSVEKTSNFHNSGTKDATSTYETTDRYTSMPSLQSSTSIESVSRHQRGTPKLSWGTEVETSKASMSSSHELSAVPIISWRGTSNERKPPLQTDESTFRGDMPMSKERSESRLYRGTVLDAISLTLSGETRKGPEASNRKPKMPVSRSNHAERPQNRTSSRGSTYPEQYQTPSFIWAGRSSVRSNMWFVPSSSLHQAQPQSTNRSQHLTLSLSKTHQDTNTNTASATSVSKMKLLSLSNETKSFSSQPQVLSQTTSLSSIFVSSSVSHTDKPSDKSSTAKSLTMAQSSSKPKSSISPYSLFQNSTEKLNISKLISVVAPENTIKYFSSGSIIEFCYYILVPWITFTFLI